jgi:hypothetical protein
MERGGHVLGRRGRGWLLLFDNMGSNDETGNACTLNVLYVCNIRIQIHEHAEV